MTLEQRVARLESFTGNIEKITSVYANSVQEICDKYLNLLYIETADANHPEHLVVDGFLSELDTVADLPHNVVFNIRPSHDFAYGQGSGGTSSKLILKRGNKRLEIGLKKYDTEDPGVLKWLEPGDFLRGVVYNVYIDSQNIAIISSNDAGMVALQEVSRLATALETLSAAVEAMTSTQTVGTIAVTTGTIANLTVSNALTLSNSITLPTGSTCSTPGASDNSSKVASTAYVDRQVTTKIQEWYNAHHLFTQGDPNTVLNSAPEKSICYKY